VHLLDGLEQVHKTGFLHRDIKPANILLNREGKPTLIDFGASRAAMVGRTTALTAIFTPGYAAAEQMTSAKQGPWTDIYGLSATLYHAITGNTPPSAFDRMLDDKYQPLAQLAPPGFSRGLCAGIDAGLTVVSISRPQSIAGWRPILGMTQAPAAAATVVIGKADAGKVTSSTTPAAAKKKPVGIWIAAAVVLLALLGGGGYYLTAMRGPDSETLKAQTAAKAAEEARQKSEQATAEAERQKKLEEEARRKAAADLAEQQKAEAEKKRAGEEAQRKAADEAEAKRKAIESVAGNFDHFGRTLLLIGLAGRPDEIHLQGVDTVDDPGLRQLGVNALASQPRHLKCRQTDRLTDGTPLYRCLITPLNAKAPIDQVPDSERVDLALALVRNGLVLASCDAPRAYADAEDEARGRGQSLWGRVKIDDYKRRCAK
jgi:serine/threonine protein kinase